MYRHLLAMCRKRYRPILQAFSYLTMIDRIFIIAQVIITLHPGIFTTQNVQEILKELKSHHKQNEILNINIQSWYSIIQTRCYFRNYKIIFAIEVSVISKTIVSVIPFADNQ